jgi:thioredoxin 1
MLKNVGLANFTQEVMQSLEPVIVDFYSEQCGPCRAMKPLLAAIASEGLAKVVAVDVAAEPELANHYGIENVPTLIGFRFGQPVAQAIGIKTKTEVLQLVA